MQRWKLAVGIAGPVTAGLAAAVIATQLGGSAAPAPAQQQRVPSVAACTIAMRTELDKALANGTTGSKPPQCDGLTTAQLQRIADQLTAELFTTPSPS